MAFSELIKNMERLREYMRDFYIYGYKTRIHYDNKSIRTYDTERRRIESYLGEYLKWEYGKNGKRVFVSVDASKIPQNPLYRVYFSKSFTDNDILLHFFLLDLLKEEAMTASQATDAIAREYGELFDLQTVRGKLREYALEGLFLSRKEGKNLCYYASPVTFGTLFHNDSGKCAVSVENLLHFFGEVAPFSVIGSYLLNRIGEKTSRIYFKHHFLMHTLDDELLLPLIQAIEEHKLVSIVNLSAKTHIKSTMIGLPVIILVSVQTGRRYLLLYRLKEKRLSSFRLDYLQDVHILKEAGPQLPDIEKKISSSWGTAFSQQEKTEHIAVTLYINEQKERFVLSRLYREGRNGSVEHIAENCFRFSVDVANSGELMSWVKTFTGRIIRVEGDNKAIVSRFYRDMRRMESIYLEG